VTIDDVLDYLRPDDWRTTDHESSTESLYSDASTSTIPVRTTGRTTNGTR
jgi:hypothetical protein